MYQGKDSLHLLFFWATETKILSRHFLTNTPCNKGSNRWAFHKWDPGRAETPTRKSAKYKKTETKFPKAQKTFVIAGPPCDRGHKGSKPGLLQYFSFFGGDHKYLSVK